MGFEFTTGYPSIIRKIDEIDPLAYGKTRNYIDGAVTYLSPYISRGVISTKQVLERTLARGYKLEQIESFVKELCWRDYFQRVAQEKKLNQDIKQAQSPIANYEIPTSIINAATGIEGVDFAIKQLYNTGYMHNHCRMYTASIVCNIAQCYWQHPSQWLYYHLLDGDFASNILSWQWVAGSNSSKKYFANQENINKYTNTDQANSFLDSTYEQLPFLEIPTELLQTEKLSLRTTLPKGDLLEINPDQPTFVYNYYNIDPLWHCEEIGNRILLLEPEFFDAYPISEKCVQFLLDIALNISGIQIFVGSFASLARECLQTRIYFKEHPLNMGYTGVEEARDWIVPTLEGYYPSFFSYWKKVEKQVRLNY